MPVPLPGPRLTGPVSLEEALLRRRSLRQFSDSPLALEHTSQLLWAAQGQTATWGGRTAPSAGALFPLALYLVAGAVAGLSPGVYRYEPPEHALAPVAHGDRRASLAQAAFGQTWAGQAPALLVLACTPQVTTQKYGRRGQRYILLEAGHAAQNALLQAAALGLAAVPIGAFHEGQVREALGLPDSQEPLYIIPVGERIGEDLPP